VIKPGIKVKAVDIKIVNVKIVHVANMMIDPTANSIDRVEMTDLDLVVLCLRNQDEMTDLDQKTLPILNTSRGKCNAPWTNCV
jgi:hypothetical protein